MKKKGFTLIELLAVIVILAIIAVIAIPIIMGVIETARKGSLEAIKHNMVKAAEIYTLEHFELLQLNTGEKEYIQLADLENGYLKKVKNPSGEDVCEGFVKVEHMNNEFKYTPYLDCGEGQNLLVSSSYVNYGGNYLDEFFQVVETSDEGYVVVGRSNSSNFSGNMNKAPESGVNWDALIVKYNSEGKEQWSRNFGGSSNEVFNDIFEVSDGYVVVGASNSQDGDMSTLDPNGGNSILVKYDKLGNIITSKILFKSTRDNEANKILYTNGKYYVGGKGRSITGGGNLMYVVQLDEQFNQEWVKGYGGTRASQLNDMILTTDNQLLIVGQSSSIDGDVSDMKIGPVANNDGVLYLLSRTDGTILKKSSFGGNGTDSLTSVVEVSDGYVATATTDSIDHHLSNKDKGGTDVALVKFPKSSANIILPLEWVQTFGGSSTDTPYEIIYHNGLIVTGRTNSVDGDLTNKRVVSNDYYDAYIAKFNDSGVLTDVKTFGGSKTDVFNSVLVNADNYYIAVGSSYSIDYDLEPFNLGNMDAIKVSFDEQLNITNQFQLQTLLKQVPEKVVKTYGLAIPSKENRDSLNIYNTNDAKKDLGNWCSSSIYTDLNSNYNSVPCIKPFDESEIKRLYHQRLFYQNNATIVSSGQQNWIRITVSFPNVGTMNAISNLKIKFSGEDPVTIREAVLTGKIEPLVLHGSTSSAAADYFFPQSDQIIDGQDSGTAKYPSITILVKPKVSEIQVVLVDSTYESTSTSYAYLEVSEFHNFDISLSPAQ